MRVGERIRNDGVLVNKQVPLNPEGEGLVSLAKKDKDALYTNAPMTYKGPEEAMVDKVLLTSNEQGMASHYADNYARPWIMSNLGPFRSHVDQSADAEYTNPRAGGQIQQSARPEGSHGPHRAPRGHAFLGSRWIDLHLLIKCDTHVDREASANVCKKGSKLITFCVRYLPRSDHEPPRVPLTNDHRQDD